MANVLGTNKADIINTSTTPASTAAADQINGGNGDDQISGDAGDDRLSGDNGNDVLDGGADNDFIDGGRGNDVMIGGTGSDTFVLSQGNDRITDFSPGVRSELPPATGELPPAVEPGFRWFGGNVTFGPLGGGDVDLESGRFHVISKFPNQSLILEAFDDNVLVGTLVLGLFVASVDFRTETVTDADSAVFSGRFTSIDEVRINASSVSDGVLFFSTQEEGDVIDVPADTNVAALVASARSDGSGGTVLNGGLTLEHTNPSDVSASWFV